MNIQDTQQSMMDHCVIFIMYDEHGGLWDHVAPPTIDEWGPGSRAPLTVISPFAKNGFVDHNQYETVSLLAFIERLFDLRPLSTRDANAAAPISPFKGQPDLIVTGTVGRALKYAVPAFNQPTSFHMSGVANGLSLDSQSGWLTGVLKQPGSCRLDLKVEGADGPISYTARVDSLPGK
jgi:hypothetical protein